MQAELDIQSDVISDLTLEYIKCIYIYNANVAGIYVLLFQVCSYILVDSVVDDSHSQQ